MSFVLFGTVSQCCDATSILDGIIYWWPILIWQSKRAHQSYNTSRRWPPFKSWNTFLHSATTTGLIGPLAAYLSSDVENIDVDDALLLVMIMVMTIGEPDSLAYIINTSHTLWGGLWLCIFAICFIITVSNFISVTHQHSWWQDFFNIGLAVKSSRLREILPVKWGPLH